MKRRATGKGSLIISVLALSVFVLCTVLVLHFCGPKSTTQGDAESAVLLSPIENFILQERSDLLVDSPFAGKSTLLPSETPAFYSLLMKRRDAVVMDLPDLDKAREWSVLLHSAQIEILKTSLGPKLNEGYGASGVECSLFKRERAFRFSQAYEESKKEAEAYLAACAKK